MNRLDSATRVRVLSALVEGNSVRATARITGIARNTILSLLVEAGEACAEYQDRTFQNLTCKRLQCDEIWSYCYTKEKNLPVEKQMTFGFGNVWTWVALDADTKLVPCWTVGPRDADAAKIFIEDLASRLSNRAQLTTDGLKLYLEAVEGAFGGNIDYAMLVKMYGAETPDEARYSPAVCTGCRKEVVSGNPQKKHVSTSYVEGQNLTMRMHMRGFTRLMNAFSKKLENHIAAISLHFMYYNFVRIHQTLRVTPGMAAGVTDRLWSMDDIVAIVEEREARVQKERKELKSDWGLSQKGPASGF